MTADHKRHVEPQTTGLPRIRADESIEESVVAASGIGLGTENSPETLSLLATRPVLARDLDDHIRLGNIQSRVAHL